MLKINQKTSTKTTTIKKQSKHKSQASSSITISRRNVAKKRENPTAKRAKAEAARRELEEAGKLSPKEVREVMKNNLQERNGALLGSVLFNLADPKKVDKLTNRVQEYEERNAKRDQGLPDDDNGGDNNNKTEEMKSQRQKDFEAFQTKMQQSKDDYQQRMETKYQGYPKTLKEALSDEYAQKPEYKPVDPNSFKGKLMKVLRLDPQTPPLTFKPSKIHPEQSPQHYFPVDLPGEIIYSVDDTTFKKLNGSDVVPIGTIVSSLAALSLFNWDTISSSLWLVAIIAAGWNIHTKRELVTRMSVETTRERDNYNYPKTPEERHNARVIKKLIVEQKGYPFSPAKRIEVDQIESVDRVYDPSFLQEFVTPNDIQTAVRSPGQFYIQLDIARKNHAMLHVDQIRNISAMNQILARSGKVKVENGALPMQPVESTTTTTTTQKQKM